MGSDLVPKDPGEFLFYQTDDGKIGLQVRMEGETVWLSQKATAELFQKDVRTVSEHIRNIFEEGELQPDSVVRNFRITAADNKEYDNFLDDRHPDLKADFILANPLLNISDWGGERLRDRRRWQCGATSAGNQSSVPSTDCRSVA